ncbi:MAG: hypothetical protein HWN81_18655 [Candidatus Lokiarchaeota archaeon]|nr:hypothetical protein [Candidatus Lokiarchaeota archaeon]
MSKAIYWQYNEFIQSRKEKLVKMLISEIIFLKTNIQKVRNQTEIQELKIALDKLEFLLTKLEKVSSDIPETDFDKIIMLIYGIFKVIAEKLEV